MDNRYLMAIIILLALLVIIFLSAVFLLGLFFYKFYYLRGRSDTKDKKNKHDFFCSNHPDEYAHGTCAICEKGFCEKCLREVDKIHFCPEHFQTFVNNEWGLVIEERSTPDTAEATQYIHDFKREIWKEGIPSYIVTHYKINVEGDFVESFVQFYVKKTEFASLNARLIKHKSGPMVSNTH
jgi:hypothetical protein